MESEETVNITKTKDSDTEQEKVMIIAKINTKKCERTITSKFQSKKKLGHTKENRMISTENGMRDKREQWNRKVRKDITAKILNIRKWKWHKSKRRQNDDYTEFENLKIGKILSHTNYKQKTENSIEKNTNIMNIGKKTKLQKQIWVPQ